MKKIAFRFLILLFLSLSLPLFILIPRSSLQLPLHQLNLQNTDLYSPRMTAPPSGYNASEFDNLTVQASDISISSDIIVSDAPTKINCYTNLSAYPQNNTLWHITLPTTYPDATNYVIQRTDVEIYYNFWDNTHTNKYVGFDTYWNYPADPLTKDVLKFTIDAPVLTIREDRAKKNTSNIEYTIAVSRLINTQRTYHNVIFDVLFTYPFAEAFDIQILDETGGEQFVTDITDQVNLLISNQAGTGGEGDLLHLRFLLGTILSNTDYLFRIRFFKQITLPSFFDDIFINILLPAIAGAVVGLIFYPTIWGLFGRQYRRIKQWDFKNILKYGLVVILVVFAILELVFYLAWQRSYGAQAYFWPF